MTEQRDKAVELLTHFLQTAWEAAGLTWTTGNDREVERLVDILYTHPRY